MKARSFLLIAIVGALVVHASSFSGIAFEFGFFVPGDTYPFDGKVDLHDLNNVRDHFGESGDYGLPGDTFEFDGVVDMGDLNAVRNNFGYGVDYD